MNESYIGLEGVDRVGNFAAAPPGIHALREEGGFLKNVESLGLVVMPRVKQYLVAVAFEQFPLCPNY
jgi:hypothetical protein